MSHLNDVCLRTVKRKEKDQHVVWLFQTDWKKGTIYKSIVQLGWWRCSAVKHHRPPKRRRSNAKFKQTHEGDGWRSIISFGSHLQKVFIHLKSPRVGKKTPSVFLFLFLNNYFIFSLHIHTEWQTYYLNYASLTW